MPLSTMNPQLQRILAPVLGAAAASGDGPWRAKTVHLALLVVLVGLGFWVHDVSQSLPPPTHVRATITAEQAASGSSWDFTRPVPGYVRVCASYIGGFFIGWVFRRFIHVALALVALAVLLAGLGKTWAGTPPRPRPKSKREQRGSVTRRLPPRIISKACCPRPRPAR
jgi:hypothetical protein